jgi:hypothetical protein
MDLARLDGLHLRPDPDVGPAPHPEDSGPVGSQLRVDLRHDAVAPLKQDEPNLIAVHVPVHRCDPIRKGRQFTQ